VALVDRDTATPEFRVADDVDDRSHAVEVALTVDDGSDADTDRTTVTVAERVETRIEATRTRGTAPLAVSLVGVAEGQPNEGVVDFGGRAVEPYDPGGQDGQGNDPTDATVTGDGRALRLSGNAWKYVDLAYEVSDRTVLRFDFRSPEEGEIHALGFETDDRQTSERFYRLYGTQRYGREAVGYAGDGSFQSYELRVGPGYPSGTAQRLVFVADEDAGSSPDAVSEFRDVIVYDEDGYTYEWDLDGDGAYDDASGKVPEYTFSAPGSYEVGVRATAPDGRVGHATRTIRVGPPPTAAANASPADPRVGERVTLSGSGSSDPAGGGLAYDWDVDGDGAYEKSGETVTHAYGSRGSRDVRLRVTDADGATDTATATVTVGSVADAVDFGGDGGTVGGVTYRSDAGPPADGVDGGTAYAHDRDEPIADTGADAVYRTERYGEFDYERDVAPGTYRLRLQFAEIYFGAGNPGPSDGDGRRVFDVSAEGVERVSDLDVHREVGPDAALVVTVTVRVDDGTLDVGFRTDRNNAKASALVVERVDGD
jgi:PKD repeat protein